MVHFLFPGKKCFHVFLKCGWFNLNGLNLLTISHVLYIFKVFEMGKRLFHHWINYNSVNPIKLLHVLTKKRHMRPNKLNCGTVVPSLSWNLLAEDSRMNERNLSTSRNQRITDCCQAANISFRCDLISEIKGVSFGHSLFPNWSKITVFESFSELPSKHRYTYSSSHRIAYRIDVIVICKNRRGVSNASQTKSIFHFVTVHISTKI